ncbi:MAG: CBS domain-containing protein [Gemmataceae bacterium]|nr:CBS domain-containing protein [Gemmataceae bacterium]
MRCPTCSTINLPGADYCERCLQALTSLDLPNPQDIVEESILNHPVSVLHPKQPLTAKVETPLGQIIYQLEEHSVGCVLLVDEKHTLAGIITERDFVTKLKAPLPSFAHRPAYELMTPNPTTIGPDDPLALALQKMDFGGYRHLPIVEQGLPIGIISVRDVLRHVLNLCSRILKRLDDESAMFRKVKKHTN